MENEIGVMAAPKAATDEEIGAMPMIKIEGMEEPQGMGAFQAKARARAFDLAAAKRADDESEEAFAGMPTDELRSRLEYVRLESRARMMMDNADSFGDEEFGSVFRELNKRRFIADDRSLAAFDALDGEGKVTNRSRLADFLAFSDRLSAAKTADEQQSLLGDKFASPALKAWREAKDNGASVAYARRKLEEEGRSWGDVGASLLENAKRLFGVKPGDEDAAKREAETPKLEDGSLLGQARKAVGDEARMWRKVGASVANPEFEWLSDRRAVAEYEKKLLGDELRAEAAKVMPFLTKAQRDLVNVYAAGGEVAQGVFKLMKPEDREMMYSMCQAVRPAADLNWLSEMAARVGMGVRSAWRGARRADVGATDWIMNKGGEFLLGKSNLWSTPEEREAIRRDMLDDIHWAQSVHDLKLKDPEGFLDKALAGYADSASMQYSMLGGALARSWAKPLAGTRTGAALAVGGLALEGYSALAMIGEQFDNMLMHGIEIDKAGPLAVCGGLVDTYVESMNLKDWFGKSLAPAEMKRVGVRAALRAALKMDGKEFMRVLRTNAKQAFKIAGSEVREELLQGMNQQGWCSLAEGKDALDAFTSSEAFQAGAEAFWEALPACTAFGVFGAANVTGSVAKGANGAYAEHLQEVSRIVARKNGVGELDRKGEAAAWRLAQNEAARVAEATKGMTRRERNEWINAQEDLTLAEKQFYAEHCDMYEASVAQDGREWADAHLSGSIDEAMFAKAGWRFEHDEKGWVTGVTTANGERFGVDFRNREATLDDLSDADKAALVEAWNREAADGEKLGGVDDPRLADAARQVNGFYSNGKIVLFGARATGATLGHEATHGMIDALSKIAGRQARRTVKALAGHLGGRVEGGKLDVGADEAAANRVEDIVFAREVANREVAPERVDVRALGKNLVTALRKAVGLGRGRVFLPVVRTAEGVEANPEEYLHDLVAESLAALAQREANEAARKKEVAEARARHKAEREEKRQRKIELRRAERQGVAREQWESAEQKAKDEEDFWKGVDAEIAAEEQKEIDAINARHDAEARLLAEEEAKVERAREAEAERQRKMSEKMLENRRNAVKTMPKFRVPKDADEAAAKRITAAYGAAWRAKTGKTLTQEDVDALAEVYGLPPEALNIKQTKNGYRLVKEQLLSDESLARFSEGLERFYDDILSVEIEVPDVVVGSVEEAANAVPNEVWDPVSETFIEGRVVVDAANAKSFREQAGLKDEDAPTVTPAEIVKSREGAAVEEDAAPKDGEETIVEKMTERAPVEELPIDEVRNDDTRIPNFKEGANPETGVVEPLMGEPYDLVANPIVVMEFKDGKKVVVTGRHRLDLYRRAGRRTIAARVIREADGWTVKDAQAIDAMANIIDEKGTVKDYVRFFENVKPTRADAEAGGWLARQKGRDAYGIYEGATPDTRAAIDWEATGNDGLISVAQAATISQVAPRGAEKRNAALQRVLVARALKGVTGRKLAILGRTLAEEAKRIPADAGSGGGATQLDLFASAEDQSLLKAMERQAEYRSRRANEYYRIAQVLRTAMQKGGKLELNAAYAKELGIKKRSSREDLAKARDLAVEKQLYWENAVQLEDADKAEMDRALAEEGKAAKTKFSVGDRRALRPADVFDTGAGDGVEIPVASLRTYKDESGESVLNAARFMSEAADGRGAKRKPLLVADNGDGTYTVVDGTATSKALAAAGAGTAYAKVVGPNLGTRLANSAYAVESVKPEGGVLRAGNAATLDEAIAQAADNADALAALCRAAAEKVGGEVKPRKTNPETGNPTKRRASAERKLRDEYAGDVSRLVDLVGGTVVIDDDGDFGDALKAIERSLPDGASIVRVKKFHLEPTDKGYGDVKVNVRFANGGVGEVILVGRGMFEGKELRGGHEVYDLTRILEKYEGQSSEIDEVLDALDQLSNAIYAAGAFAPDEANFASMKARASSSITRLIPGPYAQAFLSSSDMEAVKSMVPRLNLAKPPSLRSNATPALSLMKNMDASLVDAVRETISRPTADSIAYSGVGAQGGETRFSISHLYTGSAADYEKPSLHAVGTGEGSQVYGWGLYASNVRGVADRYANNGSRFEHNGKTMPIYIDDNTAQGLAEFMLRGCSGHVDKTINILKRDQRRYQERGLSDEKIVKAIEYLRNHGNEYKFTRGVPHVYEQTFFTNRAPGDESHLLNWYEMDNLMPGNALHEQVKWIRRQAKKEGVKLPRDLGSYGSEVYETLVGALGSPKAASEFLARADIDGVKYPVDSYGGKGVKDGDKVGWNYVSFRDDNISVDHKWVNGETRFSIVKDKDLLDRLNGEKTVRVYRAMQVIDGKLYPPMAAKVDGGLVEAAPLGAWLMADERPDLVRDGKFKLDKANGSAIAAAYNPYFHTSRSPLNDQFSSAYKRPNLVTVECEVPASELTSGYRADGAKDAVGEMAWHSGPVSSRLAKVGAPRRVILSRYVKVVRVVPDAEVAQTVKKMLDGKGVAIPSNVVTPSLRAELEKAGVAVEDRAATRFSLDVGDSLADRGKYEQVVDALSVRNAAPTNVLAADATPKDAAQHFAKNLLGKVLTMPDGETFEIRAGHFFRLTCEGKHKGFVEGYRNGEEAFAAIVNGEVPAEKINGYRQDRAVMLPLFSDVVEHPSVVLKNGNVSQFIKRYETADGRAMTAVFRMFEDGRKILSFHGFGARYGELKHYRVAYVSDAARAGTSPATSGLGTGSRADGGIVSQNGVGAQGGGSVQVEVEGDGIVEKVKRLARPAAEPGADAPRFSIGDRSAANVAKFYLAREIMENRGRMPDMRRAANVARSLGYGGSLAELVKNAQTEAAQQTQLLRYLASDPKTEKVLADAGLALRNERAVERARAAAIQFSREVGEAAEGTKRATERAVRRMKGEDYERMVVREGLDLDAILRAIRPEERAASKDGEKGEGDGAAETPAALTDADRALIAQKAAEAIANGAEAVAKAKELVKAKEDADAAKAQDGGKDAGGAADADEDGDGGGADDAHEGAIAKAIRETVAKAGFTLDSPEAMVQLVKAITEKYVRDFPGEFANLDADDPWSSPLVRAKFAANLASFAQSVADAYAPSYARVRVASRAQMLNDQGLTTVRQIEEAGEALFRDLHADVIRQSRSALIRDIRKLVKPHAKHYAENELKKDRQVDAALGRYCKFAYRVMGYSAKKCEERAAQLEQELAGWAGVEDADRDRIREFADRKMELEMIDMFGNLRSRMPAELADLRDFVEQTINESRWEAMQFGEKWEAARHEAAQKAAGGIVGDPKRGGVKPEAVETSGLYSLIGMLETKARQLTRWATGAAREDSLKAFGAVEEMIQGAEDRQFNYMQGEKAKFVDLCATVYGDHVKAGRALTAEIDRSLWDSLDRGGQKTAWTVGRVMQMYVSCVQSDYADNCAKWGRDAAYVRHLEDVLNALDPRHMDFVEGLRGIYREQGAALDEVMRRTTGTTLLTPNRLYMPVKMFRDDNIAQKARARAYSPFAPSLTPRVKNGLDFRQDVDIVDMWQERMADAAHTIGWADAGSMVQGVLQSDSVLRAIRDAHGDKVLGQWQRYVLDILAGAEQGKVDSSNWGVAAMRFCARLASRTWLALNPASWAKQLGAVPCFALSGDGDLRSVAKSVSFVALRPFEAAKVMRDLAGTAAFQARYGVAISQEMKYATSGEGQFRNWISRIMDWSMKGIMGFDKLGVYALAGVYHQKRCELETQGKGAEEASELASSWLMHIVDKTAQTTRTVNTTELQRAGGAWGILLQFKSAPAQQTQFEITAIQEALAHPEDAKRWKKAAVCVLVNHVIVPTINTAIESVVACLTSWGAPDEEKRRRLVEMWIANIVSGSLGSVVFIGTVAEGVGSLLGKVASGGDVNMYDLRNSLGRQIPAAEMLNLWVNQGDKAIKALLEVGDGDIAEGVEDMAFALGAVVPGLSWISRKGKQALDSAREK